VSYIKNDFLESSTSEQLGMAIPIDQLHTARRLSCQAPTDRLFSKAIAEGFGVEVDKRLDSLLYQLIIVLSKVHVAGLRCEVYLAVCFLCFTNKDIEGL